MHIRVALAVRFSWEMQAARLETQQQMVWRRCFYPSILGAKHGPSQSFHVPPCICISSSSVPVPPETLCCPYPQGCRILLAVASEPYFALVVLLLVNLLLFQVWPDWGNARRPSYIIATNHRLPWTFAVLASLHKLTPSTPHCSFITLRYPMSDRLTSS